MAFISTRLPYICPRCIQATLHRPNTSPTVQTQSRPYTSASKSAVRITKHLSDRTSNPLVVRKMKTRLNAAMRAIPSIGHSSGVLDRPVPIRKYGNRIEPVRIEKQVMNFHRPARIRPINISSTGRDSTSRRRARIKPNDDYEELVPSAPSHAPRASATQKTKPNVRLSSGVMDDMNWYWETLPPSISSKAQANQFFTKDAMPKFLRSAPSFRTFPESDVAEVAFVGRSNVGKSSLLNAIVNADTKALLARTSSTPGFTKTMNLYGIGPGNGVQTTKTPSGHDKIKGAGCITIVDMPGYGEGSLSAWGVEIMKYLQGRKQLRRVFVLLDAQHGIKDKDRSLLASLRLGGIPHQIILSKVDKIYIPKAKEIRQASVKLLKLKSKGSVDKVKDIMAAIRSEVQPPVGGGALGEMLACSSEVLVNGKRLGIDAVRFAMLQAVGFPFKTDGNKKGKLPRTMKTDPAFVWKGVELDTHGK